MYGPTRLVFQTGPVCLPCFIYPGWRFVFLGQYLIDSNPTSFFKIDKVRACFKSIIAGFVRHPITWINSIVLRMQIIIYCFFDFHRPNMHGYAGGSWWSTGDRHVSRHILCLEIEELPNWSYVPDWKLIILQINSFSVVLIIVSFLHFILN